MLASSSGVAMATHYCGGQAVKSAFMLGHSSLDCGMKNMDTPCEKDADAEPQVRREKCCENHYLSIDTDDIIINSYQVLKSLDLTFVVALTYTYLGLNPFETDNNTPYLNYSPPLLEQDIRILHQSFLL